jgi:glycosyltransferase involved in cell wall biosynthesis
VVTVHDLTHFQFPEHFGRHRAGLAFRLLRRAVHRAGHLIAVSQATRQALTALIPEAEGKTTVIHHGVAEPFSPLPAAAIETFKRTHHLGAFFLYVGSTKPHKNLLRVLQAFRHVKTRLAQMELVLIGVASSALSGALEGVRTVPNVSDAELIRWYNAAECLVFPSLNEGFGLPALEAMACGTPVIGSNIDALTEVTGDSGLLVNPWDVEALAQAMQKLVSNRVLRHHLRQQGLQRAKAFTWANAAEKTLQVYRAVEHLTDSSSGAPFNDANACSKEITF